MRSQFSILVIIALLMAMVIYGHGLVSMSRTVSADGPSLGDCFDGLLADEPLHCYVLEQDQKDGIIDIETIYLSSADFLFVYVKGASQVPTKVINGIIVEYVDDDPVYNFIKSKSDEYISTWGDDLVYDFWSDSGMPALKGFNGIEIRYGGVNAVELEPGWASWQQVWPKQDKRRDPRAASGPFDVSDVDFTNLPQPVGCYKDTSGGSEASSDCPGIYPSLDTRLKYGFAGSVWDDDTLYIRVKRPPPNEDVAALHQAKQAFEPCYDVTGTCTYSDLQGRTWVEDDVSPIDIVFIKAKYDEFELNQWAEILNRFAYSSGNTIDIVNAETGDNIDAGGWDYPPIRRIDKADQDTNGNPLARSIRSTVVLTARDADLVVNSMPLLLPQLSIPTDAVGVVVKRIPALPSRIETEGPPDDHPRRSLSVHDRDVWVPNCREIIPIIVEDPENYEELPKKPKLEVSPTDTTIAEFCENVCPLYINPYVYNLIDSRAEYQSTIKHFLHQFQAHYEPNRASSLVIVWLLFLQTPITVSVVLFRFMMRRRKARKSGIRKDKDIE